MAVPCGAEVVRISQLGYNCGNTPSASHPLRHSGTTTGKRVLLLETKKQENWQPFSLSLVLIHARSRFASGGLRRRQKPYPSVVKALPLAEISAETAQSVRLNEARVLTTFAT